MALIDNWTDLKVNYQDAQWTGNRRFVEIDNGDGTLSFKDMTNYTNTDEDSTFFGATDANQMNRAMNQIANSVIDIETSIINKIYPVGSIYMSVNYVDPNALFGGTWVRIQDTFLLAAGNKYSANSTGGSANAVVVEHTHTQASHKHYATATPSYYFPTYKPGATVTRSKVSTSSGSRYSYLGESGASTADASGIAWGGGLNSVAPTIYSEGESGTGKNMPPYLTVYVWKRTA